MQPQPQNIGCMVQNQNVGVYSMQQAVQPNYGGNVYPNQMYGAQGYGNQIYGAQPQQGVMPNSQQVIIIQT